MTDLVVDRRGRGRPLLFLHGATLDHRMWQPQQALADRFEVITYDLRGFGGSPQHEAPLPHSEDASLLISELGLSDVVVIGHSIGAFHALELALMRPDVVTGFVSICMSGLGEPAYPDEVEAMFVELRAAAARSIDEAKALWAACGWFEWTRQRPALAALLDRYLADYSGYYWLHDTPPRRSPPALAQLDKLAVPSLIVAGSMDLEYNDQIADILTARIPGAQRLQLHGAGHMASMEAPDQINAAIAKLFSRP